MPIPAYTGLETALRGLEADQAAIDTTGHNIANANTPGYSRERVDVVSSDPLIIPAASGVTGAGLELGTGADAQSVSRLRDQFLDTQYRTQNGQQSSAATQASVLDQVQTGLDEPSGSGLQAALSHFWQAWTAFSRDPSQTGAWGAVQSTGETVAETFNELQGQLATLEQQVNNQYNALAGGQVQSDADQLVYLNTQISAAHALGQTPNDLLDERDNVLDDLSSLANVQVSTQASGMVTVTFGNTGVPLVDSANVEHWPQALTSAAGGTLGALITLSDSTLPSYMAQLSSIATALYTAVVSTPGTGSIPFFNLTVGSVSTLTPPGNTAPVSTLSVSKAAGVSAATFSANAAALGDLVSTPPPGSVSTINDQYAAFINKVGSDAQSVQNAQTTQQALLTAISNQRQSVSGVSLDEEMTNLITYQRGYQASARMMTTIDATLDTLINHTGQVGL